MLSPDSSPGKRGTAGADGGPSPSPADPHGGPPHIEPEAPGARPDAAAEALEAGLAAGAECLAAALDYLARGWSALCLCPPDHVGVGKAHARSCTHPGKRPWAEAGRWKTYQDERPTEADLRRWWAELPNANVGMAMGPVSGLVDVDVEGEAGEARLAEMSGGDLPDTLEFMTGDGRRLMYAIPPGVDLRSTHEATGKGQEVRFQAYGSQTVMPPSRHKSGRRYAWRPGHGPGEIEAAPAPAWLVEQLRAEGRGRKGAAPLAGGEVIAEGRRDDTLASLAGTMRRRGFSREAMEAALLVENGRCDPPLPEHQVRKIARSIAGYPPAGENGTPKGAGASAPHGEPPANGQDGAPADDRAPNAGPEAPHHTDVGNARRLVRAHGPDLRYCHPWGSWLCWDGRRWRPDDTGEATRRAKRTVADLFAWTIARMKDIRRELEGMDE
jgi:hypothetical protein